MEWYRESARHRLHQPIGKQYAYGVKGRIKTRKPIDYK